MKPTILAAGGPILALSMVLACGTGGEDSPVDQDGSSTMAPGPSDSSGPPPGTTSGPPATGTTEATTVTGSTTGEGDEDPTGNPIIFDQGVLPDSPPLDQGCRKVDFLFIVDNSGSMQAQQAQLLASFPGFINAMQNALAGVVDSYHVGVLTSDDYTGNEPGCTSIGDLVTQTSGFSASNQVCGPFAQGGRFATEDDDLEEVFPCMAQVGVSGSPIEQPVTALIASFDPDKTGPGDCNDDFLRDDAILVVVIVTDDPPMADLDDAHPNTDTTSWYDDVIAAKNDDPEALVVIGFIPWMNVVCSGAESPNLIGFIDSFGEQGVKASICEPDFGPIFASTIETIVTTCENFDPPG